MSSVSGNVSKQNSYYGNYNVKNVVSRDSFNLSYIKLRNQGAMLLVSPF